MKLRNAIRLVYDQSFKAKQIPRTYTVLERTDEMIKEMAEHENVSAGEIVKSCVLAVYEEWQGEDKGLPVQEDEIAKTN